MAPPQEKTRPPRPSACAARERRQGFLRCKLTLEPKWLRVAVAIAVAVTWSLLVLCFVVILLLLVLLVLGVLLLPLALVGLTGAHLESRTALRVFEWFAIPISALLIALPGRL